MSKINVVVLAAGKGTRMYSDTPKVLHKLAGTTLLQHTLNKAVALAASQTHVVIGHEAELVRDSLAGVPVNIVIQEPQLGTAHAVHQTLGFLEKDACALILYGDVPLIKTATLQALLQQVNENSMAVLTCVVGNPFGLGRIVRDANNKIISIVEEKDATPEQKALQEINSGIMAIPVQRLREWLPRISTNNAQKEYYLTDVIQLALADGCEVHTVAAMDEAEVAGVNNRQQLAELERYYQRAEANKLMLAGVTLRDPERFDLRGTIQVGRDIEIDINVVLEGHVVLGDKVSIGPNCVLKNCSIGSGSVIAANTLVEEAEIGSACSIGPFARIRPGTVMEDAAKAGNFVEIKKSRIGKNSKISHLSYVGDSTLGTDVNIGAGTITCNYDGVNKYKTMIGNQVFIGSNSALVAPVNIGDGATIAAGSVITADVGNEQLALARSKQINKSGWKRPPKTKK